MPVSIELLGGWRSLQMDRGYVTKLDLICGEHTLNKKTRRPGWNALFYIIKKALCQQQIATIFSV